jgi:predicted aspartyl protease
VRLRTGARDWSVPVDALVDTGSARTIIPKEWGDFMAVEGRGSTVTLEGAGGPFQAAPFEVDLSIVDSNFPEVSCWEFRAVELLVAVRAEALRLPVLGWDILGLFRLTIDRRNGVIELRLHHE